MGFCADASRFLVVTHSMGYVDITVAASTVFLCLEPDACPICFDHEVIDKRRASHEHIPSILQFQVIFVHHCVTNSRPIITRITVHLLKGLHQSRVKLYS